MTKNDAPQYATIRVSQHSTAQGRVVRENPDDTVTIHTGLRELTGKRVNA